MIRNNSDAGVSETAMADPTLAPDKACLADLVLFFQKFLSKGLTISSAVPSSPSMVATILQHIDFDRPGTIIELGAGTGPITVEILEQLRPHHRFVMVENDPDFCEILRRRFPNTPLIQADASELAEPLARMGIKKVDYVVSGLPTPNMPTRSAIRLWQWLQQTLTPTGLFIQITNVPLFYRKFYRRLFESAEHQTVLLNIPPGGVYRCARPRHHLSKNNTYRPHLDQ